jgi:hypothetical protein
MRSIVFYALLGIGLSGLVACGGGKSNNGGNGNAAERGTAPMAAEGGAMRSMRVPNCGAVKAVWVNLNTRVYHEPDDPYYGKTKHGEYLCPSQAKSEGYRRAGEAKSHQSGNTSTNE